MYVGINDTMQRLELAVTTQERDSEIFTWFSTITGSAWGDQEVSHWKGIVAKTKVLCVSIIKPDSSAMRRKDGKMQNTCKVTKASERPNFSGEGEVILVISDS